MPTYDYACAQCGHTWEEVQRITAPALDECPKCRGKSAKRQLSGGGFILKGGGWYADLYSSSKPSANTNGKAGAPKERKEEGGAKEAAAPAPSTAPSTSTDK